MARYQQGRDPRVTNESCWKSTDDNLLPNPPPNLKHEVDAHYAKLIADQKHDTKVIMAHEFRENPKGYKEMQQAVADTYNEANKLVVGEDLPEGRGLSTGKKTYSVNVPVVKKEK